MERVCRNAMAVSVLLMGLHGCASPEEGTSWSVLLVLPETLPKQSARFDRLRASGGYLKIQLEGEGGERRDSTHPLDLDHRLALKGLDSPKAKLTAEIWSQLFLEGPVLSGTKNISSESGAARVHLRWNPAAKNLF